MHLPYKNAEKNDLDQDLDRKLSLKEGIEGRREGRVVGFIRITSGYVSLGLASGSLMKLNM